MPHPCVIPPPLSPSVSARAARPSAPYRVRMAARFSRKRPITMIPTPITSNQRNPRCSESRP